MELEPKYKEKIYLFGFRARETHSKKSDIDIAIDEDEEIKSSRIGEAKSIFKNSHIPYKVDILDFNCTSDKMCSNILREEILWKS